MNTKTKITEIKETYTRKQKVRQANGEYIFEEKTFSRFKEVNYIDGWPRFGAFLLDLIFILIFEAIIGLGVGIFIGLFGGAEILEGGGFDITYRILTYLLIRPLFYIIFEGSMQATPAKLILGRRVIDEYGEKPSWGQIIGRSYARVVPFEAFSCFSTLGWHDTWSNTMVLRKDDLNALKLAIRMQEFGKPDTSNREINKLN